MTRTLRIGTRGSALALVQANWTAARLAEHGIVTETVVIRTEGDDRPIDTAWGEGAFVGRIVAALLDRSVDLAVHSAKDVPTDEHPGLRIAAYPPREDPRDALVCRERGMTLAGLPPGARVGTDSPRRIAFLRAIRPDLEFHPLHGNVDTRLAKLDRGDTDALVLAVAGLARLGREDRIDDILPPDLVAWAPGQGSLALQVRADDAEALAAVGLLDDPATRFAVEAERALLNDTGGGCRSPIGVTGWVEGEDLFLVAGAERTWRPLPGAAVVADPVAWVCGGARVEDRRELARHLAARIVTLRARPRALVARPEGQAGPLLAALAAAGIDPVHVPAIAIRPVEPGGALDGAVRALAPGDHVVVASANGATAVLEAMARTGVDPALVRWAAVGAATAAVLEGIAVPGVFMPAKADAASLGTQLPLLAGDRVLVPHGDLADPLLADVLRQRGASVTEVVAYRTVEGSTGTASLLSAAIDDGPLDVLVLTSGSTARGLLVEVDPETAAGLLSTPIVASGARAAEAAIEAGFDRVLTAPAADAGSLAAFTAQVLGLPAVEEATLRAIADVDPDPAFDPAPASASGGAQ